MAETFIDDIAEVIGLTPHALFRGGRSTANISRRRQIAMFLMVVELGIGPNEVARKLRRDGTTVRHGVKIIKKAISGDPELDAYLKALSERLRQSWPDEAMQTPIDPISNSSVIRSANDTLRACGNRQ